MLGHVKIIERGATPRKLKKAMSAAQKAQWAETGKRFHVAMREARFTDAHAREAHYIKRKGENLAQGSQAYRRSYTGRKAARFGHTRPLEYTGEARRLARSANISSTAPLSATSLPAARARKM